MAWNDDPQVRDLAEWAKKHKHDIAVAFVIDISDGNAGYVSYGRNLALCKKAKLIGDALLESVDKVEKAIKELK